MDITTLGKELRLILINSALFSVNTSLSVCVYD